MKCIENTTNRLVYDHIPITEYLFLAAMGAVTFPIFVPWVVEGYTSFSALEFVSAASGAVFMGGVWVFLVVVLTRRKRYILDRDRGTLETREMRFRRVQITTEQLAFIVKATVETVKKGDSPSRFYPVVRMRTGQMLRLGNGMSLKQCEQIAGDVNIWLEQAGFSPETET